jgi:hypothetical protein
LAGIIAILSNDTATAMEAAHITYVTKKILPSSTWPTPPPPTLVHKAYECEFLLYSSSAPECLI